MKPDSGSFELERLSAGEAPELSRAVGALKERLPDRSALTALAAQLLAQGVPVAMPTASAPSFSYGARARKLCLFGGAALFGGALLALAIWRGGAVPSKPVPPDAAGPAAHLRGLAPQPTESRQAARPEPSPRAALTGARAASSDKQFGIAVTAPAEPKAADAGPVPAAAASRAISTSPEVVPTVRKLTEAPERPRANAKPEPPLTSTAPRTAGADPGPALSTVRLTLTVARPTELALLRDARLSLPTSASQALALTEQHRTLYPRGSMSQERELIAISALARLGRHAAVLERAAQFARDFPGSPYRKQVAELAQ